MNTSVVSNEDTASTNRECAKQRAEHLAICGVKSVLELCVGPSLQVLETEYKKYNINCIGNDIDVRWRTNYPEGVWHIGDALNISYEGYDAIVFAPPLSAGCTGTREDSLLISQVRPSYRDFLRIFYDGMYIKEPMVKVLVLPARCLSTRYDRQLFFKLINEIHKLKHPGETIEVVELYTGKKKIRKYVDIYIGR